MKAKKTLKDSMVDASFLMLIFYSLSRVGGYIFHIAFASYFPQSVYGGFVYLWGLSMLVVGLTPNIAAAVSRYIAFERGAKKNRKVKTTTFTGLLLNLKLALLGSALILACYLAGVIPEVSDAASIAFIVAVYFITLFTNFFSAVITGYRRPELSSALNLLNHALRITAIAAAAVLLKTLFGVQAFMVAGLLAYLLLLFAFVLRRYGLGFGFSKTHARELFVFGFFTLFYETANNMLTWTDIILITWYVGKAQAAVYNISWLGSQAAIILFMAALQIYKPVISELLGAKDKVRASHLTSYLYESFFMALLPVFVLISLYSRQILTFFVRQDYALGYTPLRILAVATFFYGLAQLFMQVINADGKPKINGANICVAAAVNLVLNIILIPAHGMVGAAAATMVSSILLYILSFNSGKKIVAVSYSVKRLAKIVAAIGLTTYLVAYLNTLSPVKSIPSLLFWCVIYFIAYSVTATLLRCFRKDDLVNVDSVLVKAGMPKYIRKAVLYLLSFGLG